MPRYLIPKSVFLKTTQPPSGFGQIPKPSLRLEVCHTNTVLSDVNVVVIIIVRGSSPSFLTHTDLYEVKKLNLEPR